MATPVNGGGSIAKDKFAEIVKCGKEPQHFISTYAYIQHPIKGKIKLALYPFQSDCIDAYMKHQYNIILKSRQLGISTISAAYAIWDAMFHKNRKILIIATKEKVAINLIKKCKYMMANLPSWLTISKFTTNRSSITFENGSEIVAITTSEDAGRSEALSLLIIDEAAFINGFDDLWTGLAPTLSTGGRAIIMSTPNGVGGMYYKIWADAESKTNKFNPIRLPWTVHPERGKEWHDEQVKLLGSKRRVAQELYCDFISSGDTFLNATTMAELRDNIQNPERKEGWDGNVWIWDDPVVGIKYIISADISRGDTGGDFSTFHILNTNDNSIVAEYKGKASPDRMADLLIQYAQKYNSALICNENNTFGYTTSVRLKESGYQHLYYEDRWLTENHYGEKHPKPEAIAGWNTNVKTRAPMLARLESLIRKKILYSRSQRLYDELAGFVWNGQRAAASRDSHDDLVMSCAILSSFVPDDVVQVESEQSNTLTYEEAMLRATKVVKEESTALAIMGLPVTGRGILAGNNSQYDPQRGTFGGHDLRWLY